MDTIESNVIYSCFGVFILESDWAGVSSNMVWASQSISLSFSLSSQRNVVVLVMEVAVDNGVLGLQGRLLLLGSVGIKIGIQYISYP